MKYDYSRSDFICCCPELLEACLSTLALSLNFIALLSYCHPRGRAILAKALRESYSHAIRALQFVYPRAEA